jgi:hypothetical protein
MYPEQIGPEVLIENSDLPNKEEILQKVKPAVSPSGGQPSVSGNEKNLKFSRDFVNVIS